MVDQPFDGFADTDHVQDADVLLGQRGSGGVNYLGSIFVTRSTGGNIAIGTAPVAGIRCYVRTPTASGTAYYADNGSNSGFKVEFASGLTKVGNDFGAPLAFLTSNAERMRLTASGSLGLGTDAPEGKFTIMGAAGFSGGAGFSIFENSTGNDARLRVSQEVGAVVYNATFGSGINQHIWQIGNTEYARIHSGGHFLIGKSTLTNELTTDGAIFYRGASGGGMTAYFANGGVGTAMAIGVQGDATAIQFFRTGSSVGSISVTSTATAYNTSSDYRLKDEIVDLEGSGDFIDALRPRSGIWKVDGSRFVGFLAHEFAEVSPSSVSGSKDETEIVRRIDEETGEEVETEVEKYQSMQASSSEVMANIIAELQSVRKRLATAEQEIALLKNSPETA